MPETIHTFERNIADLSRSGIGNRALKEGARYPTFDLPRCEGGRLTLGAILQKGPVVIGFYRGAWCPFCSVEMKAIEGAIEGIVDLEASVVAISPQSFEATCKTAEDNYLSFEVLNDEQNRVAKQFGIVFHLQNEIQSIYADLGLDLPAVNNDKSPTKADPKPSHDHTHSRLPLNHCALLRRARGHRFYGA